MNIERIKKILEKPVVVIAAPHADCIKTYIVHECRERLAAEIAALIEPPPEPFGKSEKLPDSSRLLTDGEQMQIIHGVFRNPGAGFLFEAVAEEIAQAQDAKTARAKDAECEARVKAERERVLKQIENIGAVLSEVWDTQLTKGDIFIEKQLWDSLKAEKEAKDAK